MVLSELQVHANPQRLRIEEPGPTLRLLEAPDDSTLTPLLSRFFKLIWKAIWRAFQHDAFAIAKASAYSSILTFFPTLLVVGSALASGKSTQVYSREIYDALARILPAGASTVQGYLRGNALRSAGFLFTTSLLTLWLASGVMVSWMEGFRRCYELPKSWGLVKERLIALSLVILAGIPLSFATVLIAFGSKIELFILSYLDRDLGVFVLLVWMFTRWLIAILTSDVVLPRPGGPMKAITRPPPGADSKPFAAGMPFTAAVKAMSLRFCRMENPSGTGPAHQGGPCRLPLLRSKGPRPWGSQWPCRPRC